MKIKNLAFAFTLLASISALAEVRDIKTMTEILPAITQDSAVAFDLDNTVIEPHQTIGSDQFFGYLKQSAQQGGMGEFEALQWALDAVTPIAPVVPIKAVEAYTPQLISYLQAHHIMTFALTARPPNWASGTLKQLESVGVDFSKTAPMEGKTLSSASGNLFTKGVIFMSINNKKGPTLLNFVKTFKLHVKKVIFVDDRAPNITSVDEAFKGAPVANVNFRYGGADTIVNAFDTHVASVEWSCYKSTTKIISDRHAQAIISGQANCE